MVLKLGEDYFFGADAMHRLALMSTRSGLFNRINYRIFRSPAVARFLYPGLRGGRNLLLKALKRRKINNLGIEDNDWF